MSAQALQAAVAAELAAFPAQAAVLAADLASGAPFVSIRAREQVVSASTIKVPILCCALTLAGQGRLRLGDTVSIAPEDFRDDTQVFETGGRPRTCTLWELLYWMTVESDNTATNAVISYLGYGAVNDYCAALGLSATRLRRKMLDFDAAAAGRENTTSPADQYALYAALLSGALLPADMQRVALDFLGRSRCFDGLQRYIPDPVPLLHKSGGLDHLNHDAGVFQMKKRPYFLGVFTWDGPALDGESPQKQLIGRISRLVYDYVNAQEAAL